MQQEEKVKKKQPKLSKSTHTDELGRYIRLYNLQSGGLLVNPLVKFIDELEKQVVNLDVGKDAPENVISQAVEKALNTAHKWLKENLSAAFYHELCSLAQHNYQSQNFYALNNAYHDFSEFFKSMVSLRDFRNANSRYGGLTQLMRKEIITSVVIGDDGRETLSNFGSLIGTFDLDRLRFCEICSTLFWAKREESATCSAKCFNALRQRRFRKTVSNEFPTFTLYRRNDPESFNRFISKTFFEDVEKSISKNLDPNANFKEEK